MAPKGDDTYLGCVGNHAIASQFALVRLVSSFFHRYHHNTQFTFSPYSGLNRMYLSLSHFFIISTSFLWSWSSYVALFVYQMSTSQRVQQHPAFIQASNKATYYISQLDKEVSTTLFCIIQRLCSLLLFLAVAHEISSSEYV